jgi:cytochrome P450
MMHDPEVFIDPMVFQPERYLKDGKLNPDVRDPDSAVFGFGRFNIFSNIRANGIFPSICPGRHLSDNSLYLIVSRLLAVYDIKPAVDDHGNILEVKPEFSNGLLS